MQRGKNVRGRETDMNIHTPTIILAAAAAVVTALPALAEGTRSGAASTGSTGTTKGTTTGAGTGSVGEGGVLRYGSGTSSPSTGGMVSPSTLQRR